MAIDSVHRDIAQGLIAKSGRLAPEEIRFLRKHLGFSGTDLAAHMGVAAETVSRWENGAQEMGAVADRLLRLMVSTQEPVQDYRLETLKTTAIGDAKPLRLEIAASGPQVYALQSFRIPMATSTGTDPSVPLVDIMAALKRSLAGKATGKRGLAEGKSASPDLPVVDDEHALAS